MSEDLDLGPANELRKEAFRLVVRGKRRAAVTKVYEHLRIVQEDPAASEIDCKDGCAYCCSLPVMITVAEAELIADSIEGSGGRDEIIARLRQEHAEIRGLSADELSHRRLPCSLLDGADGQGSCSVYEVRPLACRSFTSDDVDLCRNVFEHPEAQPSTPARPIDYLTQLMTQSGLAGPGQKAFEMRALLLELLTKEKRKKLQPASIDVTFRPERAG